MKRMIKANDKVYAEEEKGNPAEEMLADALDDLNADFDYFVDSVDKMVRDGDVETANSLVADVSDYVNEVVDDATSTISSAPAAEGE